MNIAPHAAAISRVHITSLSAPAIDDDPLSDKAFLGVMAGGSVIGGGLAARMSAEAGHTALAAIPRIGLGAVMGAFASAALIGIALG